MRAAQHVPNKDEWNARHDRLGSHCRCSDPLVDDLWDVLGDLVDALSDDLRHEVTQADEVRTQVVRACKLLGGPYEPYLRTWVGHVE